MLSGTVLSAVLALAGGAVAQKAVSSDTYSVISKYHSYAAAAYSDECPEPPNSASVVRYFNQTTTDTQATLFYSRLEGDELVISFRGSSSPVDLDYDLDYVLVDVTLPGIKCPGCKVHRGFQNALLSVSSSVISAVKAAQAKHSCSSVVVTGHSLGAGLASLAATMFVANGIALKGVYTYGEPRNGNPAWSSYVDSQLPNYYRVTHYNDGVPQIPPAILDFKHHGTEYWLSQSGTNSPSTTYDCGKGEPQTCNAKTDFGAGPINGAHVQYIGLTASALFNPGCGYRFPS